MDVQAENRATDPLVDWHDARNAHLVGIAGTGMRALAEVLAARGWSLHGSDQQLAAVEHLRASGATLLTGHRSEHLAADTEIVIHSDAITSDNPELRRARSLGIPTLSYFDFVGNLTRGRPTLAVAGTHGKSTTTAMLAHILTESGADPTVFCGATPLGRLSGGRASTHHFGHDELVVVEACEYRSNFLHLKPTNAAILNIEPDHFDCFDTFADLQAAFGRFARRIPSDGELLIAADSPAGRKVTTTCPCRVTTFGIEDATKCLGTARSLFQPEDRHGSVDWAACHLRSQHGKYHFDILHHEKFFCHVVLRVPGKYNVLNAIAATAMAAGIGTVAEAPEGRRSVTAEQIGRALGTFTGLHRRLETLGRDAGILFLDDYAHHPTEVRATLEAVRQMAPNRRIWCVFQPHQVSRTRRLLDELAKSLQNADRVLVADIFRAREGPPRPGEVTAADLARRVRRGGTPSPDCHDCKEIDGFLQNHLRRDDVLLTMGAGDIRRVCNGLIRRFREDCAA